jgi:hypothetical protein
MRSGWLAFFRFHETGDVLYEITNLPIDAHVRNSRILLSNANGGRAVIGESIFENFEVGKNMA